MVNWNADDRSRLHNLRKHSPYIDFGDTQLLNLLSESRILPNPVDHDLDQPFSGAVLLGSDNLL